MDATTHRRLRIPPLRRVLCDFLHFAKKVPLVTAERRMKLGPLIAARNACLPKPSWTAIFLKAFAQVARRQPELRRVYCPFPWPHFYEHGESIGFFTVERQVDDEPTVLFGYRRRPDQLSLSELTDYVRRCQEQPVEQLTMYRRMRRLAYLPTIVRRLLWRLPGLVGGRHCVENFGTFGLSSTAAHGAGMATILSITTSTLHYGLFDAAGSLDFRLTFDHRVYDGALAGRVLTALERTLMTGILAEVQSRVPASATAA